MSNSQLALTPVQAARKSLRVGGGKTAVELVEALRPENVFKGAISALCDDSPLCKRLIARYGPLLIFLYAVYTYVWKGRTIQQLLRYLLSKLEGKIKIPGDHPMNERVLSWMAQNEVGSGGRELTLHQKVLPKGAAEQPSDLSYIPPVGSSVYQWKGHKLKIERLNKVETQVSDVKGSSTKTKSTPGSIVISCRSPRGGVNIIKDFLRHVYCNTQEQPDLKTRIFRVEAFWDGTPPFNWSRRPVQQDPRSMDSVMMEDKKKASLLQDIGAYLESKQWYQDRGIPYRRGYLFYGPPGTGKTSLCMALAGHFKLPLYLISLSRPHLDDSWLEKLFDALPKQCLVVLEDVDSSGIQRENRAKSRSENTATVTLSGLLNVIDGPCSHEGRVLILTSNSPDALDPALVRPGRVDRKFLFGNATHEITEKLFQNVFKDVSVDLAQSFALKVPEDKLTPAEIQNFILENRDDAVAAIERVGEWAERVIATKTAGRNVVAFADQIGGRAEVEDDKANAIKKRRSQKAS